MRKTSVNIVTAPTVEPLTVTEAQAHLRLEPGSDNATLTALILTAREYCEDYTGQALVTRTLELTLDEWPGVDDEIRLQGVNIQELVSIKYHTETGSEVEFSLSNVVLDAASKPGRLVLANGCAWPSATLRPIGGIKIQYKAGYGDSAADVPAKFKQAMLLMIGHWYERREETIIGAVAAPVPFAAHALLNQERFSF